MGIRASGATYVSYQDKVNAGRATVIQTASIPDFFSTAALRVSSPGCIT
jgi:hypothetical protein